MAKCIRGLSNYTAKALVADKFSWKVESANNEPVERSLSITAAITARSGLPDTYQWQAPYALSLDGLQHECA